jgi:hypothetical protein
MFAALQAAGAFIRDDSPSLDWLVAFFLLPQGLFFFTQILLDRYCQKPCMVLVQRRRRCGGNASWRSCVPPTLTSI